MKAPEEMLCRMEALVRRLAAHMNSDGTINLSNIRETGLEAAAIVADLPEPVDPDLVEARKLAVSFKSAAKIAAEIMAGMQDNDEAIQALLSAIKRGRALEKEQQA